MKGENCCGEKNLNGKGEKGLWVDGTIGGGVVVLMETERPQWVFYSIYEYTDSWGILISKQLKLWLYPYLSSDSGFYI